MNLRTIVQSTVRMMRGEISTKKLVKQGLVVGKNFSRMGGVLLTHLTAF